MTDLLNPGEVLGDYVVVAVVGAGGMGVVYRATQRSLGRDVALKLIRDEIAGATDYRERFLREARLAASVSHPNVVTVYDAGELSARLFLAMQWIDGRNLRDILATDGRLAPDRAIALTLQVADALTAVHEHAGMVHRDVKPANVLVTTVRGRDHAYLTDFGVARLGGDDDRLTSVGLAVGTAGYLSPEQIRGGEADVRSDVYSLGCVCFETLAGRPPFIAANDAALRWAHANDPRPAISDFAAIPHQYDQILSTALAIDPADRFGSVSAFADALESARRTGGASPQDGGSPGTHPPTVLGSPTPVIPPSTPVPQANTPTPRSGGRERSGSPIALIALGAVAVVGVAVGVLSASGAFSSHQSPAASVITAPPHQSSSTISTASKNAKPTATTGAAPIHTVTSVATLTVISDSSATQSVSQSAVMFHSPSNNIACSLQGDGATCTVASLGLSFVLPLGGGGAYTLESSSVTQGAGDTAPYGTTVSNGPVTCTVPAQNSPQGITCDDTNSGHGFQASRVAARQQVY